MQFKNLNDNPNTMPVISEDIMVKFVLFCANMLLLKWSTIKIYVAGIRFHYIKAGLNQPFQSWDRLHYMLNAVRRKQGNTESPKRLPITFSVLNQLCAKLKTGVFSPHTDDMLQSVLKLAFFGFLRCGEFTIKSASDYDKVIRIKDVVFNQSSFTLHLRGSKTDPYHSGIKIYIASNIHLCPVLSMCKFIHRRIKQGAKGSDPLFVDADIAMLSRSQFISYLRHLLVIIGLNDSDYNGHSFRIGAATTAAQAGVEDHLIQTMGRWSSNCYTRYIHTSKSVLKNAQHNMCTL